jgi:hypothetical protein
LKVQGKYNDNIKMEVIDFACRFVDWFRLNNDRLQFGAAFNKAKKKIAVS